MSKKTRRNVIETTHLRNEMRRLKQIGQTSEKIMLHLKLDRTNFDYHMQQIYKEDKKQLRNVTNQLIEHEILICKSRLERCRRIYKISKFYLQINQI